MGSDVVYVNDMYADHNFPTDLARNPDGCFNHVRPWISNCHYDGVGEMFKHIIPNQEENPLTRNLDWADMGTLSEFD